MSDIILTLNTGGEPGEQGPPGPQGRPGDRGQTGARGPVGERGERGPIGAGIQVLGSYETSGDLPAVGSLGDSYIVDQDLWTFDGLVFRNMGPVRGPQGLTGIPGATGPIGPPWIMWRGNHTSNTAYVPGDGVMYLEASTGFARTMRCVTAHNSPAAGNPPVMANWEVVLTSIPGPTGMPGIQGEDGPEGPVGERGERGYDGPQGIPGSIIQAWAGEWAAGVTYEIGDMIRADWTAGAMTTHALLICTTGHLSTVGNFPSAATYPANWSLITQLQDGTNGQNGQSVTITAFSDEAIFNSYIASPFEIVALVD